MNESVLSAAIFVPRVGERFELHHDHGVLDVELIDVTDPAARFGADGSGALRNPFSIVFRGSSEPVLPQRIYRLEHTELEPMDLFLIPIGPDGAGMRYEAVFG